MPALVAYFGSIPSSHRALILAGGIAVFWLWETAAPLFRFRYVKWQHAAINIFFTLTTIVVNFALAFILLMASEWVGRLQKYTFGRLPARDLYSGEHWHAVRSILDLSETSASGEAEPQDDAAFHLAAVRICSRTRIFLQRHWLGEAVLDLTASGNAAISP